MRKLILLSFFNYILLNAQSSNIISREWTSFVQAIKVSTKNEKKFKLTGNIKVEPKDKIAWGGLWVRIDTKDGEPGYFNNMGDRKVRINEWKEYNIEGTISKNSESLNFGGLCMNNGDFYFDNLKLFIENETGIMEEISIVNGDFEKTVINNTMENWFEAIRPNKNIRITNFKISSSKDAISGKKSLLISGSKIKIPEYDHGKIGKDNAENPQIDNMISMLEDLKDRVENKVKNLPQKHVDHLHDPKANRIGALVMHLAAAEVYYQKYTFGESVFEKKNPELWKAGMNLDDAGRELLQGKPISFYLDIYNKVRAKTIEELRKRDDVWFRKVNTGNSISNQYAWFHVMEHQSSHLGQILFLAKRLPPIQEELKIQETIKN